MVHSVKSTPSRDFSLADWIKHIPAKIQQLLLKISRCVRSFFKFFSCSGKTPAPLTDREVRRLRNEKLRVPPISLGRAKPLDPVIHFPKLTEQPIAENHPPEAAPLRTFDPALDEMRTFARDLAVLTADKAFEHHLLGQIDQLQTMAPSLPPVIKSLTKLFVEMGDKAAKPLFQKFAQQKEQMIDPTLKRLFRTLIKPDPQSLYNSLYTQIKSELKESPVPSRQQFERDYLEPILSWLLLSDHSTPLNSRFLPINRYDENLVDTIFERAVSLLLEKKIDDFAQLLEKTVHNRLGEITQNMLRVNAGRIADYLSERVAELIESTDFTKAFDTVVENILHSHIQGVIAAEKEVAYEKELLEKSKVAAASKPYKVYEQQAKEAALNHLAVVAQHGSEEHYLDHKRLEAYSKQPACAAHMKEFIGQSIDLEIQGRDSTSMQRASEKAIFDTIGERLLDLMMPTKKTLDADGNTIEVDPFSELWDRLLIPDEFRELISYSEELTKEFITSDTLSLLENIKKPATEIVKNIFKTSTKDQLRKHLGLLVKQGVKSVSDCDSLDSINARSTFPTLNRKLITTFAKHQFFAHIETFRPLLHSMMSQPPEERSAAKKSLFQELSRYVKGQFRHFDPSAFSLVDDEQDPGKLHPAALPIEQWIEIITSVINGVEDSLSSDEDDAARGLTQKQINHRIALLLKVGESLNRPQIGNMVMDLIFNVGDLNSEWIVRLFIKDSISQGTTGMLEHWRAAPGPLVQAVTRALRSKYLETDAIKNLISGKPTDPEQHVNAKLSHQIDVTSRLAYDILISMAERKGFVTKVAVTSILGETSAEIYRQISKVYKKVLGNGIMNENLVIRSCESVLASLGEASEKIRLRNNIQLIRS